MVNIQTTVQALVIAFIITILVCAAIAILKDLIDRFRYDRKDDKSNGRINRIYNQIIAIDCTAVSLTVFFMWIFSAGTETKFDQLVKLDTVLIRLQTYSPTWLTFDYAMFKIFLIVLLGLSVIILLLWVPKLNPDITLFEYEIYKPCIRAYNLCSILPLTLFLYFQILLQVQV
jgi:hypothetical protein